MGTRRLIAARMRKYFPGTMYRIETFFPHHRRARERFVGLDQQQIFTKFYKENLWGDTESRSGGGSTLDATARIREALPPMLSKLGVRRLLDAPCGDFNWMSHTQLDLDEYIGGDIVEELIRDNNEKHASDGRRFVHLDLTSDPLPSADALFCRDCLIHLTVEQVMAVLRNVARSDLKYLITTTFPQTRKNREAYAGGVHTLNLRMPPFGLPAPIETIQEETGDPLYPRELGVWTREQVAAAVG